MCLAYNCMVVVECSESTKKGTCITLVTTTALNKSNEALDKQIFVLLVVDEDGRAETMQGSSTSEVTASLLLGRKPVQPLILA